MFRHGDRTPITTFPLDPVKPSEWPNGYLIFSRKLSFFISIKFSYGQLTPIGIEQQHYLGAFIRKRYQTLLSPNYTASEIIVRSTDVDRTLMSAQANLVGLYPTLNVTTHGVPIQPVPIHTVSVNSDFVCHIFEMKGMTLFFS